jgi:phosphinothricin acetyltransferase
MIRIAKLGDLPAIVSIYNEAVASSFATADMTAVSVDSRRDWFTEHEPTKYPIYVLEDAGEVRAWCSLSPYRRGRMALRFTAEISYYVQRDSQRKGIASRLVRHAISDCEALQIKNLFAIVLEPNTRSCSLLEKLGFERWGFLPCVADFDGQECGHLYYGQRLPWPNKSPEPTAVGAVSSAIAVHVVSRRWLSFLR